MADSPRDDFADLARLFRAHVAWQRELGASDFPRGGQLPGVPVADVKLPPPPAIPDVPVPQLTLVVSETIAEAPPAPPPPPATPEGRVATLRVIQTEVASCTNCKLSAGRTQTVFARGDPFARLCFVGEGPGEQEDIQGLPFVGPAGQLLDRMIAAMGLTPEQVYIANVVKCRPPNNRTPTPEEMATCSPFLARQLEIIRPEVIVALGRTAVGYLLRSKASLGSLRGHWSSYRDIPVLPTWHPSYILRSEPDRTARGQAWEDLKLVMARMGLPLPPPRRA